jgi:hypothetical protein
MRLSRRWRLAFLAFGALDAVTSLPYRGALIGLQVGTFESGDD